MDYWQQSGNIIAFIGLTIILAISVILLYIIQIILHELGHLLFGWVTGYRLLSFRLFSIVIFKQENQWKIGRLKSPGSIGQCIMLPSPINYEKQKYILYISGGLIVNLLSAMVAMCVSLSNISISFLTRLLLLIFTLYGFGCLLMNLVLSSSPRVFNDGSILKYLKKNSLALRCYFYQLEISKKLMDGCSYGNIAQEKIILAEGSDLSNPLIGYHKILQYFFHLDRREWIMARKCLDSFYFFENHLHPILQRTLQLEELFFGIITKDGREEKIILSHKYQGRLFLKFRDIDWDMNLLRIFVVYHLNHSSKRLDMNQFYNQIEKVRKHYPYLGEIEFCVNLIRYYIERI